MRARRHGTARVKRGYTFGVSTSTIPQQPSAPSTASEDSTYARRYWDFLTAGNPSLARIERQIHHYASSLNAIHLLDYYRRSQEPSSRESLYDLQVGYGGSIMSLSNIDESGFGSMAFHSYSDTLAWDSYTGDFGPSFVGHTQTSASYLVEHPDFGWIAFGGNAELSPSKKSVIVSPVDTLASSCLHRSTRSLYLFRVRPD